MNAPVSVPSCKVDSDIRSLLDQCRDQRWKLLQRFARLEIALKHKSENPPKTFGAKMRAWIKTDPCAKRFERLIAVRNLIAHATVQCVRVDSITYALWEVADGTAELNCAQFDKKSLNKWAREICMILDEAMFKLRLHVTKRSANGLRFPLPRQGPQSPRADEGEGHEARPALGARRDLVRVQGGSASAVQDRRRQPARRRRPGIRRRHFRVLDDLRRLKRGDIWTASGGPDYAGKSRPVLIIQDDQFDSTGSITTCPMTTQVHDAPLFRIAIDPTDDNGLRQPSFVMADKIATVPRERFGKRLGALKPTAMVPIDRAMLAFLGLAGSARG